MLKANELRLDNWVTHKGVIIQIASINDKWVAGRDLLGAIFIKDCEGIPITPEILLACGFSKTYLGYDHKETGFNIYQSPNPKRADKIYPCWNENICSDTHLVYLHTLQNCFFALTGKELIYQPK